MELSIRSPCSIFLENVIQREYLKTKGLKILNSLVIVICSMLCKNSVLKLETNLR